MSGDAKCRIGELQRSEFPEIWKLRKLNALEWKQRCKDCLPSAGNNTETLRDIESVMDLASLCAEFCDCQGDADRMQRDLEKTEWCITSITSLDASDPEIDSWCKLREAVREQLDAAIKRRDSLCDKLLEWRLLDIGEVLRRANIPKSSVLDYVLGKAALQMASAMSDHGCSSEHGDDTIIEIELAQDGTYPEDTPTFDIPRPRPSQQDTAGELVRHLPPEAEEPYRYIVDKLREELQHWADVTKNVCFIALHADLGMVPSIGEEIRPEKWRAALDNFRQRLDATGFDNLKAKADSRDPLELFAAHFALFERGAAEIISRRVSDVTQLLKGKYAKARQARSALAKSLVLAAVDLEALSREWIRFACDSCNVEYDSEGLTMEESYLEWNYWKHWCAPSFLDGRTIALLESTLWARMNADDSRVILNEMGKEFLASIEATVAAFASGNVNAFLSAPCTKSCKGHDIADFNQNTARGRERLLKVALDHWSARSPVRKYQGDVLAKMGLGKKSRSELAEWVKGTMPATWSFNHRIVAVLSEILKM